MQSKCCSTDLSHGLTLHTAAVIPDSLRRRSPVCSILPSADNSETRGRTLSGERWIRLAISSAVPAPAVNSCKTSVRKRAAVSAT